MSEIAGPDMIGIFGAIGQQPVRKRTFSNRLIILKFPTSFSVWPKAKYLHHSEDSFLVNFQMNSQSFMAVAEVIMESFLNISFESPILLLLFVVIV
jgi:hypothetical protein